MMAATTAMTTRLEDLLADCAFFCAKDGTAFDAAEEFDDADALDDDAEPRVGTGGITKALAADFLATFLALFFTALFFATFLAELFLAVFFTADFFADFLAVDFFAAVFFTADFLAVFFAADFFAVVFFTATE